MCKHDKFGFCKFQDQCRKEHLTDICLDLSACKTIKTCHKRHPKVCRRSSIDKFYRFGINCAYFHVEQPASTGHMNAKDREEKLVNLENTVLAMGQQISTLTIEMEPMKSQIL